MSGTDFLNYIKELSIKYGVNCYVEYRDSQKRALYKKINLEVGLLDVFKDNYKRFFLCAKELNLNTTVDFYDDELLSDTIEIEGGRENTNEMEWLDLRMLSKKPNGKIRLFSNSLINKLKKDSDIGKGVIIGEYFNKDIYFLKDIKKKIWESFERKQYLTPIKIPII